MRNQIKSILKLALSLILLLFIELSALGCFGKTAPQLASIDPNRGTNQETVTVTLTGAKFEKKAIVKLTMAGQADIMAREVKFISKTRIVATFDLNGKAAGQWDIVVCNTARKTAKLDNAFMIEYPAPSVISVSPNQGANNSPLIISSLIGSGFRFGIKVLLRKSDQPEVIASRAALFSNTELTCGLDLTGVTPGVYDVAVVNEDGKTGILANGFTVLLFTPDTASQSEESSWETAASDDETAVTEDTVKVEETEAEVMEEEPAETEAGVAEETMESEEEALEEEPAEAGVAEETMESEEEALEEEPAEAGVAEETMESEEEALEEEPAEAGVVEEIMESEGEPLDEEDAAVADETTENQETMLDLTQAYALQALLNVLENKGILTMEEVLEELERIKSTMGEYLEKDEMADEYGVTDEDTAEFAEDNPKENAE
ncbi:MAG: hypothetical protein K6U80_04140 [Firmicutes bacterium]|nr:hypothetical protein [Bacillota bacterium]